MNDRIPPTTSTVGSTPPTAKGRRRFLGAGVSATPALMTLVSQPALGVTCFTPSRSLSKNTSVSQVGKDGECNGRSPGNYGAQTEPGIPSYTWPAYPKPDTPFHDIFSGDLFTIPVVGGTSSSSKSKKPKTNVPSTRSLTFLEVIRLNPTSTFEDLAPGGTIPVDPANLGKHIAAAYLNCVNGFIDRRVLDIVLNEFNAPLVQNIWKEWDDNGRGYYEVMAGVKWYAADIVQYLTSNGIAP